MRWTRALIYLAIITALVAFPYGPFFPWSPVHPGYDHGRLGRADILFPHGESLDAAYLRVDEFITEAEKFHGLAAPKRITIIACRDWSDFRRFVPQIAGRAVGAVTIQTGTAIFVTPKLREKQLDTAEFLRHELSHAVLHQNQSLLNAYRLEQQQWFCEGLAVLFGRQRSYLSASEFTERARTADLRPVFDGSAQADMRFSYQAWRYFLEYSLELRGRDTFLRLENDCIESPGQCRGAYAARYGRTLEQAVSDFQNALRDGRFIALDAPTQ